ncbi:MAG: VWA domain-containing protein [Planctomycetaceae bacterium]|nr:VWA domain-containing protein [Planctomycetaceae bacterium]
MIWGYPAVLLCLWLVPLTALMLVRAERRRRDAVEQFADPKMALRLVPGRVPWKFWGRVLCVTGGLTLLIPAASRPQFGLYFEEATTRGVDLFVVLDVSRSMLAEDVRPNRLEHAKSDIRDLLSRLEGDRVGLIVFAGAPIVQVPLTTDQGFFLTALDDVDTDSAPRGGTMIGDAIRKAMESMEIRSDRDQAIVLITDGGDQDSFPDQAAQLAAERNIHIITVGLGDVAEGARIPQRTDSGALTFVQHDGQEVWSRMDEDLLKRIAVATSGAYVPARTFTYDLGAIYDEHLAGLTQGDIRSERQKRYREQYQLFAVTGLILLLAERLITSHGRNVFDDAKADSDDRAAA